MLLLAANFEACAATGSPRSAHLLGLGGAGARRGRGHAHGGDVADVETLPQP